MVRVYYLCLTKANFVSVSNNRWLSPVIDLYSNNWYKNYSTVKSNYGLTFNNSVWIGLEQLDVSHTDAGIIEGSRFIDTTGIINVVSYRIDGTTASATLDAYGSDKFSSHFPDEWVASTGITSNNDIDSLDTHRYFKFAVNFDRDPGTDTKVYVRIEIGSTLVTAKFGETNNILFNFPQWMDVREVDTLTLANPHTATPTSIGGKLINSISGEWLDDISQQLTYLDLQHYISTVDLNQKAWAYKTTAVPDFVYSVVGDGNALGQAVDQDELYKAVASEHVYWWDENTKTIYSNLLYTTLIINGNTYSQTPHHVWNWLDEMGLSVDLSRLYLEGNDSYRHRIADVYKNHLGAGIEEFKLALRRELNIWKYYSATPSSDYLGATPEILEVVDIETDPKYMSIDGLPTDAFVKLVDDLSRDFPTTWGRFKWDKAIWDIGGEEGLGYKTLPIRYDATPLSASDIQGGIGDGNDLFVYRPDVVAGPHNFTAELVARGQHRTAETHYPGIQVNLNIYGRADRKFYSNPTTTVWLTLEIQTYTTDATPVPGTTYTASFQLSSTSDVDVDRAIASVSSYGSQNIFTPDSATDSSLNIINKVTGLPAGQRILAKDIYQITLHNGKWDVNSQTYVNITGTDIFQAWFSDDNTDTLIYNAGTPTLSGSAATPTLLPQAFVVMKSKQTSFTINKWTSEPVAYTVIINGASPNTSQAPFALTLPSIAWDNYLESVPNKEYVLVITSNNTYGGSALTTPPGFVASSSIAVNGNTTWTGGNTKILSVATTTATFSSSYSVTGYVWTFYEATETSPFSGLIDENGPWHNGQAPLPGNTNYMLYSKSVGRSNFGIPLSDSNYIISWIGIVIPDDGQVIAWLDSNSVTEVGNSFGIVTARAKLRTDPAPQWDPQLNVGWFYEGDKEYYFYASPNQELINTATPILSHVARQGAPIIAKTVESTPREFRQVAFFDQDASPVTQTLWNKEILTGNGSTPMFLAYPDIYNATVLDLTTGQSVAASSSSSSNVIYTSSPTDNTHTYEVTYVVNKSFFAQNDYETGSNQTTRLFFDKTPGNLGVSQFSITYEGNIFNPATPIDLPLSPLFTVMDEGFIFISHNEYTLDKIIVNISPSKIIADGQDYIIVTMRSVDQYDNPKPNQTLHLASTFGSFDHSTVITDHDGFAVATLTASNSSAVLVGTITVTGAVNASIGFDIDIPEGTGYRLYGVVNADQIPADGTSTNIAYGKVEDASFNPKANAVVAWKKARSIYDLFASGGTRTTGSVTADTTGGFTVGPFTSASPTTGFWFLSMESNSASPSGSFTQVGDVVFWYEYPGSAHGVNRISGLPQSPIQMTIPTDHSTPYAYENEFPVYYDEASPDAPATPVTLNWIPPTWYPLDRYTQYQLGILGATPYGVDPTTLSNIHPSFGVI